jgi:hypothetical protein
VSVRLGWAGPPRPDALSSLAVTDETSAELLSTPSLSYSYRASSVGVWRNRAGVTSALFSTAMALSYLLGRSRR